MAFDKNLLVVLIALVCVVGVFGLYTVNKNTANESNEVQKANASGAATLGTASFAKSADVVSWSNGFPSGEHYNLNIHGKKAGFYCDPTPGGGSVFVPEYGQAEIQYIQNRKASIASMYVIDPCSFSPNDPAKIQLPSGEYQVYARILAKPGKKSTGDTRSVVFYPKLIDACDDTGEVDFNTFIDCNQSTYLGIGKITSGGVFDKDSQTLERIVPTRGNNRAENITELFQWSGYACDSVYDTDGDGQITLADVTVDFDADGDIDAADLAIYLELYCSYFEHEWVFNIADLVVYGWDYTNMGSKLVQVRFYPMKTTQFI